MLSDYARQLRDTLLRFFPDDKVLPRMNIREWAYCTTTRYLELQKDEQNAYVQLLDECFAHVQGGFPFNEELDEKKTDNQDWIKRCGGIENARLIRKRMIFEFVRVDFLFIKETGEILFADLEPYRIMKQFIDKYDDFTEKRLLCFFSRLDLIEHDNNDGYDLVSTFEEKELSRTRLNAGKLTTRFAKVLFDHEGEELTFSEIYHLMGVTKKSEHRIPQWISALGIDNGECKGLYIKIKGDLLIFHSAHLEKKKQ